MGMSAGANSSKGRRGRRGGRKAVISEINVTPLVDVMLVLLIVFMVAAPLMTVGVSLDLPQTQAKSLNVETKPITVSVTNDAKVFIGEDEIALENLVQKIAELSANETNESGEQVLSTDKRIFVRGDANADYGSVMKVMGILSKAGYSKIGLITEQEQGQ
jgi:biopolymer transport protein TolR